MATTGAAGPPAAKMTSEEIIEGMRKSVALLRSQTLSYEYRIESDAASEDWLVFPWEEMVVAVDPQGRKIYGRHTAQHKQGDGSLRTIVQETGYDGDICMDRTDTAGFISKQRDGAYWLDSYHEWLGIAFRPDDLDAARSARDLLFWIPDCFDKAQYTVEPFQEDIDGVSCHVLYADNRDRLWIDTQSEFAVRKRRYSSVFEGGEKISSALEFSHRELREARPGLWLPRNSVLREFGTAGPEPSRQKLLGTKTLAVRHLEFGNEIPADRFKVTFPLRTVVLDQIRNVQYRVIPDGTELIDDSIALAPTRRDDGRRRRLLFGVGLAILIAVVLFLSFGRRSSA